MGTWTEDNFTLTGIEIETLSDGGFHLRQKKFVDQLELMSLSQRRSRADTEKLTPSELTQLRAVSGSAVGKSTVGKSNSINSFGCADSMPMCQFEYLRFLWKT